jgi:hypothetical protein
MNNPSERGGHPAPRDSLYAEVSAVLNATGLPRSAFIQRDRACGLVLTQSGTEAVEVEWFVSLTVRQVAAEEQLRALPNDAASLAQESVRRHIHLAIFGILSEAGYAVQTASTGVPGALQVRRGTEGLAGGLAQELHNFALTRTDPPDGAENLGRSAA